MCTMKFLIVIACLAATALAGEKYTDKYDNINLDEIMENERLLRAYVDCIMDRGKCTAEGNELKSNLKDAIQTACEKCTKAQEEGATKIIDFLIKKHPDIWKELTDKYDPEGEWCKKYQKRAQEKGIEAKCPGS